MPKLSLWQGEKYTLDAKWIDQQVLEQFVVGGVDLYVHKYMGANNPNVTNDATQPVYPNVSAQNIQDLLFLENRDRIYDKDIYRIRGHYAISDLDLDLSQFGLMIASGTIFITIHTINCVDTVGRKLMSGDVIELPNLKEFYSLDETVPVALKRYYVVQDATRASVGYSPTWWSHLWRCKCTPLVDSQEFSQILNQPVIGTNGLPILINGNTISYGNINSSGPVYQLTNDAVVAQAEFNLPLSGYDTNQLFAPLYVNGDPKQGPLPPGSSPEQKFTGYLVGNGEAVDGYSVTPATVFPDTPTTGQYVLRQDYFPARLYRWSGNVWQYVNSNVRTGLTPGTGQTMRDKYINNANTFVNSSGNTEPIIQTLSNLFRPDRETPSFPPGEDTVPNTEYIVPFSPTPAYPLQLGSTMVITLTGDVTPVMTNPQSTLYTFVVFQDSVGQHTYNWPSNFIGAGNISPSWQTANPNTVASQTFAYIKTNNTFIATTNMTYGPSHA